MSKSSSIESEEKFGSREGKLPTLKKNLALLAYNVVIVYLLDTPGNIEKGEMIHLWNKCTYSLKYYGQESHLFETKMCKNGWTHPYKDGRLGLERLWRLWWVGWFNQVVTFLNDPNLSDRIFKWYVTTRETKSDGWLMECKVSKNTYYW